MPRFTLLYASTIALLLLPGALYAQAPWDVNAPITGVDRTLVEPYYVDPLNSQPYAPWIGQQYVGPEYQLEETKSYMGQSDTPINDKHRFSWDNGETWTDWTDLPPVVTWDGPHRIYWGNMATTYDPMSNKTVSIWLRQTKLYDTTYYNQSFLRTSDDYGQTWSDPQLLMYEAGADFNPLDPYNMNYLENNTAYPGQNIEIRSDGSLNFSLASANIPDAVPQSEFNPYGVTANAPADARAIGAVSIVANWNSVSGEYDTSASNVAWVPRHVSSRGLAEPTVAELNDERLLTVYRDSNSGINGNPFYEGGHKRYTLSTDGGATISDPLEWKYDDGTSFYSPSSISQLIRHSVTDKLYWVGNINLGPANGNHYRYPLVIAEVDEVNVALKKDTVTLIDDRQVGDGSYLQLSNFSILENRQTHNFEVRLTRLGEDASNTWKANAYTYILDMQPQEPPPPPVNGPVMADGTTPYAWYRADRGVSVVGGGNNSVTGWADQSGNQRDLLSVRGDPELVDDGTNVTGIEFDGMDDYFWSSAAAWGTAEAGTVFAVWKREVIEDFPASTGNVKSLYDADTYPGRQILWTGKWNGDPDTWLTAYGVGEGIGPNTVNVQPDPVGPDNWVVTAVSYKADGWINVNGQEVFAGDLESGGMDGLIVGNYLSKVTSGRGGFEGELAELVIFEGELTPEEVATIELILMSRWGLITMGPGDTNNDGVVDAADARRLAENWLKGVDGGAPEGDFNGDGLVDDLDASILAAHWGSGGEQVVPEPGVVALMAGLMLLVFVASTRRLEGRAPSRPG
ncbi:MAG: hypothetical protein JW818_20970 [Pirellulales bacterium]|nr:hypothetical protein [Pirellulales bacterium]